MPFGFAEEAVTRGLLNSHTKQTHRASELNYSCACANLKSKQQLTPLEIPQIYSEFREIPLLYTVLKNRSVKKIEGGVLVDSKIVW